MNTITKEKIHTFAKQMLGLQYDEKTNEFFTIYGQYAAPELVGTRRVVTEETILKEFDNCSRNY